MPRLSSQELEIVEKVYEIQQIVHQNPITVDRYFLFGPLLMKENTSTKLLISLGEKGYLKGNFFSTPILTIELTKIGYALCIEEDESQEKR